MNFFPSAQNIIFTFVFFSFLYFCFSFFPLKFNPDPTECSMHDKLEGTLASFREVCAEAHFLANKPSRGNSCSPREEKGGDKGVLFWMSLRHAATSSLHCKGAKQSLVFCSWEAFLGEPQLRFLRRILCLLLRK